MEFLIFSLANQYYGVKVNAVLEINRRVQFSKIAATSEEIIGFYNLRNKVVPIVDLEKVFYKREGKKECKNIIIFRESEKRDCFAIEVDTVDEIVKDDEIELITAPTSDLENEVHISHVAHFKGKDIQIIDESKLVF